MKRFGFSSFLVDDSNRIAFEQCSAVARLQAVEALPVTLLGEEGSGKTHLLCAIVNHVRASENDAGIVYVAGGKLPDDVQRLVSDAKALDKVDHAILLVDDLDCFEEEGDVLEALVDHFLSRNHFVVIATSVHPQRLTGLPPGLQSVAHSGRLVEMHPGEAQEKLELIERKLRRDHETATARQEREMQELKSQLESVTQARKKESQDKAGTKLLRETAKALTKELEQARGELEHLRAENTLLSVAGKEAKPLRERLARLEEGDETIDLRGRMGEARSDAKKARKEARDMLKRAQILLENLQESREDFVQAQEDQHRHLQEIEKLEGVFSRSEPSKSASSEMPADLDVDDLESLRHEHDGLKNAYESAQASLVRARADRETTKDVLKRTQQELRSVQDDVDRNRLMAQEHLEAERKKIVDLEANLSAAHAEIEELQESQRLVAEEMLSLQSQLSEGSDVLGRLMGLFGPAGFEELNSPACAQEVSGSDVGENLVEDAANSTAPAEEDVDDSPVDSTLEPTIYRPTFGETLQKESAPGGALHHIEELHSAADFFSADSPSAEKNEDGSASSEDEHKSA